MPESHDIHPLIFYRISKPLKKGKKLPCLEITDYIESIEDKFELEITPNYGYKISERYIEDNREAFNEYEDAFVLDEDEVKSKKLLNSFLSCLNRYFTVDNINNFSRYPENYFKIEDVVLSKDLESVDNGKLQKVGEVYLELNKHTISCFNLMRDLFYVKDIAQNGEHLRFRKKFLQNCIKKGSLESGLILGKLLEIKHSIFLCSMDFILKRIFENLPVKGYYENTPNVEYDRPAILEKRDTGAVDHKGRWTMFGLTMIK